MPSARERHLKRKKEREAMATRPHMPRQITPSNTFQIPQIKLPFGRWTLLVPMAVLLVIAVVLGLGAFNPPDIPTPPNAIWLDRSWTYAERTDASLSELVRQLQKHDIGTIYAFVSSLKPDNTWSGHLEKANRWNGEGEPLVTTFAQKIKLLYPNVQLYAWIEVIAETAEGYRLDSPQVQRVVADFSGRMVNVLPFDGVLLDLKPIFTDNEALINIIRLVRGSIGLNKPLAVVVPPDLTPSGVDFNVASIIAPNTVWTEQYKQRVSLQADQLVVAAYNSYLNDPIDYIYWVTYQVQAFSKALDSIETRSQLIISVPNYAAQAPAHDPLIESISAGIDGVVRALADLSPSQQQRLRGIAIFTDRDLTNSDWAIFREKWQTLNRQPIVR